MDNSKKRSFTLMIIALIIVLTCITMLVGCSNTDKMYSKYTNLASNSKLNIKGKAGESKSQIVDLGTETTFNTIVLGEKSNGVTGFKLYASNDNNTFDFIYEGDTIEDVRNCFVGELSYRYIKVEVTEAVAKYNVNSIKVYNNINENTKKRVTTYFLLDRINDSSLQGLETVTDIILFSFTRFDKDGNVCFHYTDYNENKDYTNAEAKLKFTENLAMLKAEVGEIERKQNRKINILATILMPWSDDPDDANKYSRAIMEKDKVQKVADGVKAFMDEFDLDGVDFDYEYPYKNKEHKLFDNFLVVMKNTIGKNKLLSTALGAWNIKMSKEAINAVDRVQLMTYDIFDSHGYHGSFYFSMVNDLHKTIDKGIPAEKICLGVPFYSRPITRAGYWGDYFRFYNEGLIKNKYMNYIDNYEAIDSGNNKINDREYFNGYQMIQDKMSFVIDTPVAGIMIWHYHCDIDYNNELSLFRAIHETLVAKKAGLATK